MRLSIVGLIGVLVVGAASARATAQVPGAARIDELVRGLSVANRVMVVGMRPDDEDPYLMGWLSGTERIETAFLSLTRGESAENALGSERGVALGIVRASELATEHQSDDIKTYFTRAYDYGAAKDTGVALAHWNRASLIGDIVACIRSFRPHTIVVRRPDVLSDSGGEYDALSELMREALTAAADTTQYAREPFGSPWRVTFTYWPGHDISVATTVFDPLIGSSADQRAVEARGAQRVASGILSFDRGHRVLLGSERVEASYPVSSDVPGLAPQRPTAIKDLTSRIGAALERYSRAAELLTSDVDVRHPAAALESIGVVVGAARALRDSARRCGHPSRRAVAFAPTAIDCDRAELDVDAFADRALNDAEDLFALAAGIELEAASTNRTLATTDTGSVEITITNHGTESAFIDSVTVAGTPAQSEHASTPVIEIKAGKSVRLFRALLGSRLQVTRPWWLGELHEGMFPVTTTAIDGVSRPDTILAHATLMLGSAIPEGIRRSTDVRVQVRVGGTSVGVGAVPVESGLDDPRKMTQRAPIAVVPEVALSLDRGLQWVGAGNQLDAHLVIHATSFSDAAQRVSLIAVAPKGTRLEGVPSEITLAPHEDRILTVRLTGVAAAGRSEVGVVGRSARNGLIGEARRLIEYAHLPPIPVYNGSGLWLQSVNVTLPPRLSVLLVGGDAGAGVALALQQLRVRNASIGIQDLMSTDLTQFRSIVLVDRSRRSNLSDRGYSGSRR